jgi:hypothetical protein
LNINMGIVITYIFGVRLVETVVLEKFAHIVSTKVHCRKVVYDTT